MKRFLLLPVMLFFSAGLAFSLDFGLFAEQKIETDNNLFLYNPSFTPWFSWDGGEKLSVYLSGIFSLEYYKYSDDQAGAGGWTKPALKFELSRSSLNYRINKNMSIEAGRVEYSDALSFAAAGLFDGVRFMAVSPVGNINAGLFYTGLLYKRTANILMTGDDAVKYAEPWGWDNISGSFASRRLLAALRWDIPLGEANTFSVEILSQFDLNGGDQTLHSQYGEIKVDFFPRNMFVITAGAVFEAMENGEGDLYAAFGALAGFKTALPGSLNDWLNINMKFSSGFLNDAFSAFTPLNSIAQGTIFQNTISGLALLSANYSVRINNAIFAEGFLRYFIRTYDDPAADGNLYGGELWASFALQPLDDIRLALGAGVFFPGLGNVYPAGTELMWKINTVLSLSF